MDHSVAESLRETTHFIIAEQDSTAQVQVQKEATGASCTQTDDKTTASIANMATNPSSHVSSHHISKLSPLVFPVRIGITWKKGERLEAQDFSMTWYPSKIVEISEEEKAVLIHFEGWNQRYDEWVEMSSSRLRPCTRHSERKDKDKNKRRRVHPHPIYRPGDEVLAKWKDCKKYPAKISRLIEESTYEVIFYDGVTHLINAINIQPLPEEMKASLKNQKNPSVIKNKSSFKQVPLVLPSSVRQRQDASPKKRNHPAHVQAYARKRNVSPLKINPGTGEWLPKVKLKRDRELDVYNVVGYKDVPDHKPSTNRTPTLITCEATLSTVSEEECRRLFGEAALACDTSSSSADAFSEQIEHFQDTVGYSSQAVGTAVDAPSGTVSMAVSTSGKGGGKPRSRMRKRAHTDTSLSKPSKKSRKKSALSTVSEISILSHKQITPKRPQAPPLGSSERSKSLDLPSMSTFDPSQYAVPSKAFIIEEDHNPYKCPFEGCPKDFRKENLLHYHIKYYHTVQETTSALTAITSTATVHSPHTPVQSDVESSTESHAGTLSTSGNFEKAPNEVSSTSVATQGAVISTPTILLSPHLEPQSVGSQRRRRRKTDSICSTDSEKSAGSRGRASTVRQRNDSEISVTGESPDVVGQEHLTASSRLLQDLALQEGHDQWEKEEELICPDTEEADEEEMASDVVNCICRLKHTQGLMIQCEVCLCWQHFKCADVKKTGKPPANYVCLICEQSPGARDSCKFMHDLSWERRGELPTYTFKQQSSSNPISHLSTLSCECNDLLTTLHSIKRALHSTRRQIKISKEEDDPEFQLWQTDWDNWTKPEEDLAQTFGHNGHEKTYFFHASSNFSYEAPDLKLFAKDGDEESSVSASETLAIQTKHSSSPSLQPSQTQPILVSPSEINQTMSSQQFSVSATPPKITKSAETIVGGSSSAALRSLASQATSDLLDQVAKDGESKDCPVSQLVINTAHNTTLSAVSPSLSSLPSPNAATTPPIILSPVACPPPTPSSGRSCSVLASMSSLATKMEEKGNLVRDLFPGSADHTTSSGFASNETKGYTTSSPQTNVSDPGVCASNEESVTNLRHCDVGLAPGQAEKPLSVSSGFSSLHGDLTKSVSVTKADKIASDWQYESPSNYQGERQQLGCHKRSERLTSFEQAATIGRQTILPTQHNQNHDEDETGQQNGDLSPECTSPVQPEVNGFGHRATLFIEDDEDTQDIDTDTAEESAEPYRHCEQNLLVHIQHVQSGMEDQLHALEDRIQELENSEHNNPQIQLSEENILNDIPALKKSLSKLARYLTKVQHLSS